MVLLLLPFYGYGQQMEWSNSRKLKGTSVFTKVLGENNHGIFLLRHKTSIFSKQIIFEKYKTHLGLESSRSISLNRKRLVSSSVNDQGVVLFTTNYNKTTSLNELYGYYLDSDLQDLTIPKVLDASPIIDFYDRGDFTIRYSVNNKRILVFHTERTNNKKLIINLGIFTTELENIRSKQIELPYDYDRTVIRDLMIDDSGNVFMLIVNHKEISRRSENREIINGLFFYNPADDKITDYSLNDGTVFLINPRLSIDRKFNKINVTAFYSNNSFNSFTGVYKFTLPYDSNQKVSMHFEELSDDLISSLIGKVRMEKGIEVSDFQITTTVPTSDGGIILVAERTSVSSDEDILIISGVAQTTTRNIYNYDDVLVLALDTEGRVNWHHVINKNQSSMNDGGYFGSIIVGVTPSNIHIIYNDKLRGNGDIMQYSIDGTGEITSKILVKSERNFISVIPSEARQIGANELLLPTMRDKKFALLKLIYDK